MQRICIFLHDVCQILDTGRTYPTLNMYMCYILCNCICCSSGPNNTDFQMTYPLLLRANNYLYNIFTYLKFQLKIILVVSYILKYFIFFIPMINMFQKNLIQRFVNLDQRLSFLLWQMNPISFQICWKNSLICKLVNNSLHINFENNASFSLDNFKEYQP